MPRVQSRSQNGLLNYRHGYRNVCEVASITPRCLAPLHGVTCIVVRSHRQIVKLKLEFNEECCLGKKFSRLFIKTKLIHHELKTQEMSGNPINFKIQFMQSENSLFIPIYLYDQ